MKPKVFIKPPEYYEKKQLEVQRQQALKRKKIQDSLIKIVGKFNKDLTDEKHRNGLINSDEENSSVYIDPVISDPLYKESINKKTGLNLKGTLTTSGGGGDEEMSSYSVYGR